MQEIATPDLSILPGAGRQIRLTVNGEERDVFVDSRTTLLDCLRERLRLTGTKKGCDHGQCGACTILVEGQRVLSPVRHGRRNAGL